MSTESLIQSVLTADSLRAARTVVRKVREPDSAEQLFSALVVALGSSFKNAVRLAAAGQALLGEKNLCWVHRFRAVEHRLNGRWKSAATSFLAAGQSAGPDRQAEFSVGAIDSLARTRKLEQAVSVGEELYQLSFENPAICTKVALNTGHALAWFDRLDEAKVWYERAVEHAEQADLPMEMAMALVGLSTALLGRGEPESAIEPAIRAKGIFVDLELGSHAATATMNIAEAERDRGAFDRAISLLLECRDKFDPDEEEAFRVKHDLAGVYLAMNMWVEAEDCYQSALAKSWANSMLVHKAGCWQGIAEARRQMGRVQGAREAADRARKLYRKYGDPIWEASAYRQYVELIDSPSKRQISKLGEQAELLKQRGFIHHLAEHEICMAKLGSDESLRSAEKLVGRCGMVHREWEIHFLRAQGSVGESRRKAYGDMMSSVWRERQRLESRNAMVAFLHDKTEAIQVYLKELLTSDRPEDTLLALETIGETRSIALIDEILSSDEAVDPKIAAELDSIRRELSRTAPELDDPNGRRRLIANRSMASLRRRWTEATQQLRRNTIGGNRFRLEDSETVFVECGESLFSIDTRGRSLLPISKRELETQLRWLYFELSEPATNDSACASRVSHLLSTLSEKLFVRGVPQVIAPEGAFWAVPWQALAPDSNVHLSLTPGRTSKNQTMSLENIVVWYQEDSSLPHVQYEVKELVEQFPHARVCRTISEARESLSEGSIDLLHVAAHGRHQLDHPMLSTLGFCDGELSAAEISRSGGRVGAAVLTACHSGAMNSASHYEPDGLSRSFLSLGAKSVISGQWAIDDQTGRNWSSLFYQSLKERPSFDIGTSFARQNIKNMNPHPYFWAPFIQFLGYNHIGSQS